VSFNSRIYQDQELPSRARLVYMYLRDRANRDGASWPSIKTIAKDTKLSRSTVKRALRDLEREGYLVRDSRYRPNGSNTSNLYTIR
jgi:DNA-binding GntR family transcriptional regulator